MLNKTCNDEEFSRVFKELKHDECLELPNNNLLKMYYTKIMNNKFEYSNLQEFLLSNITNYVFSRKENKEAGDTKKIPNLTKKALMEFRKLNNENDCGNGGELGELLLYVFLESDLNAYKLLSKMELKTNSEDYIKGADGIYLYEYEDENKDRHFEYVIGEAKIEATSAKSIADAFDSILIHLQKENFERELVNREIFKETFSEEQVEEIKKILVPSADDDDIDIQKAFGIFIGYGLNKDLRLNEVNYKEGKKIIEERIEKDIKNICKNIKNKIRKNTELKNYSFYVYVMPFKDAQKDRVEILKSIIM